MEGREETTSKIHKKGGVNADWRSIKGKGSRV